MKLVVAVFHPFALWCAPAWLGPRLEREFHDLKVEVLENFAQLPTAVEDADILMTWSLREGQLATAKKLRWIHSTTAAVQQLLTPEIVNSNVVVTNSTEVHGGAVAEHAMALLLACAKQLGRARDEQHARRWGLDAYFQEGPMPRTVTGSTLVLVGLGAIGRRVARLAEAFGMRVIGVRRDASKREDHCERVVEFAQLDEVLPEADYVLLAAPVTDDTRGMIDRERLSRMKHTAYVVNVARGVLVDEHALAEALREKQIAGAALDVFDTEPLPPESELWTLPSLIITPHSAGVDQKVWDLQYAFFTENLRRFLSGEHLRNVVDKQRGY